MAVELKVKGLMNVQFAVGRDGSIYVLEVNPRASRTDVTAWAGEGDTMKTLIAVLLSTTSALAQVCPYPATENVDGCNGAPAASTYTVRHSNFFTGYAQQSGQTYFNSHPPQWNVAGVDYPVGISEVIRVNT